MANAPEKITWKNGQAVGPYAIKTYARIRYAGFAALVLIAWSFNMPLKTELTRWLGQGVAELITDNK